MKDGRMFSPFSYLLSFYFSNLSSDTLSPASVPSDVREPSGVAVLAPESLSQKAFLPVSVAGPRARTLNWLEKWF